MTPKAIIAAVAARHGLPYGAVIGRTRVRAIVAVRYEAMRAVKMAYPHLSTVQIGRLFHRDHSTVCRAFGGVTYSAPTKQRGVDQWNARLGGPVPESIRRTLGGRDQRPRGSANGATA